MPFFPVLVIANQTPIDDEDDEDFEDDYIPAPTSIFSTTMPIPMSTVPPFINIDREISQPISPAIPNDDSNTFRLRMHVDGFQANELNISIRHGRLIVRGKHIVRSEHLPTTNSTVNENDDIEPDFVAKEFKRTFLVPSNADIRKAHAQYYPQQQLLLIEIPYQNSVTLSQTRFHQRPIRSIDVFLTIVTLILIDRALRITYEQFMLNEQQLTTTRTTSSRYRNQTERETYDLFF